MKLRGLYAITPEAADLERKVRLALEGGIALLQYRSKARERQRYGLGLPLLGLGMWGLWAELRRRQS